MLKEINRKNISILHEYFNKPHYQTLLVDLESQTLSTRSLLGRVWRFSAVTLSLLSGFLSPYFLILTPFIYCLCYTQNENINDIAKVAHTSLLKDHINLLLENSDCSECIVLQQKVTQNFSPIDLETRTNIVEEAHKKLFAQRLELLRNGEPGKEKSISDAQERFTQLFGKPTFFSQWFFNYELNKIFVAKQITSENALLIANHACNFMFGKDTATGFKAAAGAAALMFCQGPTRSTAWHFFAACTVIATDTLKGDFSPEEKMALKAVKHSSPSAPIT